MLLSNSSLDYTGSDEKLGFLIWRLVTIWQRKLNRSLSQHGITHSQYVLIETLYWLAEESEKVTQVMIARRAHIDPMMVSVLLKPLLKKDVVKRKDDKKDTRSKNVELTSKGYFLIKKLKPEVEKFDAAFFASGKVNNKQLEQMIIDLIRSSQEED